MVKNQHYVPQRYLRCFRVIKNVSNKKSKIHLYDKVKKEIRLKQNIANVASENYFYDVDFKELLKEVEESGHQIDLEFREMAQKVDKQTIENLYANEIEGKLFSHFENIISTYYMTQKSAYEAVDAFNNEHRAKMAYYLIIQYIRTKEFREKLIQMHEQGTHLVMRKALSNEIESNFFDNVRIQIPENKINFLHNQELLDFSMQEKLAGILLKHIWFVAVNETNIPFYTSDNPFTIHGHLQHSGIESKGVEIVFPLNSKLAIVLREINHFWSDRVYDNKFREVSKEFVERCNSNQVIQSYRYIFSEKDNFDNAKKLVKEYPNICETNRKRFIMG